MFMISRIIMKGTLLLLLAGCSNPVLIHVSEFRSLDDHTVMAKRLIKLLDSDGNIVFDFSRSEMKLSWLNGQSAFSVKRGTYLATYACAARNSTYWKKRGNCSSLEQCDAVDSEYRHRKEIEIVSMETLIDRNGDYTLKNAVCSTMLDSPLNLKGVKLD